MSEILVRGFFFSKYLEVFFRIFEFLKIGQNILKNVKIWLKIAYIFLCSRLPTTKIVELMWNFSQRSVIKISRVVYLGFLNFWKLTEISSKNVKIWLSKAYIFVSTPLTYTKIVEIERNSSQRYVFEISRHVFRIFEFSKIGRNILKKTSKFGSGRRTFSFAVSHPLQKSAK